MLANKFEKQIVDDRQRRKCVSQTLSSAVGDGLFDKRKHIEPVNVGLIVCRSYGTGAIQIIRDRQFFWHFSDPTPSTTCGILFSKLTVF